MLTHRSHRPAHPARTPLRAAVATLGVLCLVTAAPAVADAPVGWAKESVSPLGFLLVLVLIPLGLALVIGLLAALPSIVKGRSYEEGEEWRTGGAWFGAAGQVPGRDDSRAVGAGTGARGGRSGRAEEQETTEGGASGQW